MDAFFELRGRRVPRLIYGTAWKEERTAALCREALAAGFRGFDTANQRKHYLEVGLGQAIAEATRAAAVGSPAASTPPRESLFLQTKFTYARGQDHRLPYDPQASLTTQVRQSFQSSLEHLQVTYVDSFVLHGPESGDGWSRGDREVWRAMEALHAEGGTHLLGVSNITRDQLAALLASATVAPAIVQNRCYARTGWDREVRAVCRDRGIAYQAFSLLTANRTELASAPVVNLAGRLGATVPQLVFRFAMEVGMMPLTGTSSRAHMDQDLAARLVPLDAADLATMEDLG